MQSCDVYCLPSFGEPFGMTALEAMACARPVVATDAGGLRHLVAERGGRKVPPGDADALAAALREVLADPELRRAMGEHNRRRGGGALRLVAGGGPTRGGLREAIEPRSLARRR